MTIEEFTKLTGIRPNPAYFVEVIHPAYMAAGDDVDKVTFCKRWTRNGGLQKMFEAMEMVHSEILKEKNAKIESLEKTLDEKIKQVEGYYKTIRGLNQQLSDIRAIVNQ